MNGILSQNLEWHKRLLNQVALEVPGIRPAVISPATRTVLENLLNFRHVIRNIYGFELKPERIEELVAITITFFPQFASEIETFNAFLLEILEKS